MKNFFSLVAFLFAGLAANAQVDIKINPIGLLFRAPDLSAEFALNESSGVEGFIGIRNWDFGDTEYKAFQIGGDYRFYFNPEEGIDKFYVGAYGRYFTGNVRDEAFDNEGSWNRLSLGMILGYKWVSRRNIVFEPVLGIGRALFTSYGDDFDSTGIDDPIDLDLLIRLNLGYRFGGGDKK